MNPSVALAADGAVVCDLLIRFVVKLSSSRAGLGNCGDARCELGKRCGMLVLARVLRASSAWALRLLTAPWPAGRTQSGSVLAADGSGLCSSSPASLRSSLVSFTIIFSNISGTPRDLNMYMVTSGTVGSSRYCALGWPTHNASLNTLSDVPLALTVAVIVCDLLLVAAHTWATRLRQAVAHISRTSSTASPLRHLSLARSFRGELFVA